MKGARPEVAGIAISHPQRVFWPADGITKLELARYHESIADWIVPHLRGRPLTLLRCEGTIEHCASLRHARAWGPSALRRVSVAGAARARALHHQHGAYFRCRQRLTAKMVDILGA